MCHIDENSNEEALGLQKPVGNAAALREALDGMLILACGICANKNGCEDIRIERCGLVKKARAALAAPPRNCDRYATAVEAMEELKRAHSWCAKENRRCLEDCPDCGKTWCSLAWLFAPAEKGADE